MIESASYIISFLSKKEVAKDTHSFFFTRPEGFEFLAGQYNRWILPIEAADGRGNARFFTISSSPLEKDHLSLTTKIIQSDFKKALLALKEQNEIKIFGPMGQFILDENDTRERIFLAGGIGITPYHSIVTYAAEKNLTLPLTLLVSFSVPEEMVFYEELTQIAKAHENITVVYTVTKPQESSAPWSGETGRISSDMIKKYVKDLPQSVFYVVGPPPMVEGTKQLLHEMNIPEENIKLEQFTGY